MDTRKKNSTAGSRPSRPPPNNAEQNVRYEKPPKTGNGAHGQTHPETPRSEEHTSELQSRGHLVCRLLLEKKKRRTVYTKRRSRVCRHAQPCVTDLYVH